MKYILYTSTVWIGTILFTVFLFWIATIPNFAQIDGGREEFIKTFYKIILYSGLFMLVYRSFIYTLKFTVDRLSTFSSNSEKSDDAIFVTIIESLVIIISVLLCIIIAGVEEYLQIGVEGRTASVQDVLVSTISALLTALLVYSLPILGEIEFKLWNKTKVLFKKIKSVNLKE